MLVMAQQGAVNFLISENGRQVAEFTRFAETPFVVEGERYRLMRDRTKRFTLEGPTGIIAGAHRVKSREIEVNWHPYLLRLRRPGMFSARWDVFDNEIPVGACELSILSATGDLPAELPLLVRTFLFYVAIMSYKGYSNMGGAGWR
jgi:hypothetical protein